MKGINEKMKKTIKTALAGLLAVPALALGVSAFGPVAQNTYAVDCSTTPATSGSISSGALCAKSDSQQSDLFGPSGLFRTITNVLLFIIGAISVIMLIIGGIRYVVSGGDSSAVTAAKNTILYAVIGIIVALLAFAIVNFVLGSFAPSGGTA